MKTNNQIKISIFFYGIILLTFVVSCSKHATYEAHFINDSLIIDGNPDSIWDSCKKEPILNNQRGKMYWGDSLDLSGTFRVLWNKKYLYVFFDITDNIFFHRDDIITYYNDGVEVYLDVSNDKKDEMTVGDDYQLQFVFDSLKVSGTNFISNGIRYKRKLTGKGYTVEIAIPWSILKYNPNIGRVIGFDAGILDNDTKPGEITKTFETTRTWSLEGRQSFRSTKGFGNLRLTGN